MSEIIYKLQLFCRGKKEPIAVGYFLHFRLELTNEIKFVKSLLKRFITKREKISLSTCAPMKRNQLRRPILPKYLNYTFQTYRK